MPVEIEVHTVPDCKAPVNAKVEPGQFRWVGTFMYNNSIVNLGGLVHKTSFVKTGVVGTHYVRTEVTNGRKIRHP